MKISKVNHTRAAVNKMNVSLRKDEIGGVLYQTPAAKEDIEIRIRNLGKKAKDLYQIFVPIQVGVKPKAPNANATEGQKKTYEEKIKKYNSRAAASACAEAVKSLYDDVIYSTEYNYNSKSNKIVVNSFDVVMGKLKKQRPVDFSEHLTDKDISFTEEEFVLLYLRNSLKPALDGAIAVIKNAGNENINADDAEKIREFVELVRKDYGKQCSKEYIQRTIKSIHNQNMVIQAQSEKFMLPSPKMEKGNKNSTKIDKKDGANAFLSSFANLDANCRLEHLRKIRRLIDLYFAVPEDYKTGALEIPEHVDKTSFDIWQRHEHGKTKEGTFVPISDDLYRVMDTTVISDSAEKERAKQTLRNLIAERNKYCYRGSLVVAKNDVEGLFFDNNNINLFWVDYIQATVEKTLSQRVIENPFKLNISYLSEKIWEAALNYISTKYIAVGKAVYHFGLDELQKTGDIRLGEVSGFLKTGITSADYEMIKANESIQRETVAKVLFATNNLARAAVKLGSRNSDFLEMKDAQDLKEALLDKSPEKTVKNILQFFGGESKWDVDLIKKAYGGEDYHIKFLQDIQQALYAVRNESFHFATLIDNTGKWDQKLFSDMFACEMRRCAGAERIRFYSNNLPRFYSDTDLQKVMDCLYAKYRDRAAQIPSFEKVFVRKKFKDFLSRINMKTSFDADNNQKWESGIYYLFKQIYYNDFLASSDVRNMFLDAVKKLKVRENAGNNKDKEAIKDFRERCDTLENLSLPEICQALMTEYNIQNSGRMKVRTSFSSKADKPGYQHYEVLLKEALNIAFAEFVKDAKYSFLWKPEIQKEIDEEEFLPDWHSPMYETMIEQFRNNPEMQKWYILCHFLNNSALNQLVGSLRSYKQYVGDIKKRVQNNKFELCMNENSGIKNVDDVVQIIEACIRSSAGVSKLFSDYFDDEDAHAEYLSRFLDFGFDKSIQISAGIKLDNFCNNRDTKFGIYMDGRNPILNSNVVNAKLYGPADMIAEIYDKVTENDVNEYYASLDKITEYREKGNCKNKVEQSALNKMQELKNHVELRDVVTYSELVNELLAQLVNWSAIRERDLMYFQLGFHYNCLNNDAAFKPKEYVTITREDGSTILGAILYQIVGTYVNGIGIYKAAGGTQTGMKLSLTSPGSVGSKIKKGFVPYTEVMLEELSANGINNADEAVVYDAGLEVFEKIKENQCIVAIRNYIDHFRYYLGTDTAGNDCGNNINYLRFSILDLYSEVFDRFFTDDYKYRKNVTNVLLNVLEKQCFVIAEPTFGSGTKVIRVNEKGDVLETKNRAQIEIASLYSDKFTYKTDGADKTYNLDAKSETFLRTVAKILYYPAEVPETCKIKSRE